MRANRGRPVGQFELLEPRLLLSGSVPGAIPAAGPGPQCEAVPTFESVGLYWSPPEGSATTEAQVAYRAAGETAWKPAQDLWYDGRALGGRPAEYRGSIVGLTPGTQYEVQLTLAGTSVVQNLDVATWSEDFPIAQTIQVSDSNTPLEINNVNGSASGYILYTGPATIDVNDAYSYDVRIQNSSYVILCGLTLTGAQRNGILLGAGRYQNSSSVHDIVIQNNDISDWGTVCPGNPNNWGYHDDAGIRSDTTALTRVVIERNNIHDPRTNTNSWKEQNPYYYPDDQSDHPEGPVGINLAYSLGNFVVCYNQITGSANHRFEDGMGEDENFGYNGFGSRDMDIYGNVVTYTWDDAIEMDGAGQNVRVWGNYTNQTYTGVSMAGVSLGPLYVFRNVFQQSQTGPVNVYGGVAFKRGGSSDYPSDGRIYIYNNTIYYTIPPTFQGGIANATDSTYATNTIALNNILCVRGDMGDNSVYDQAANSTYDYDLYNGGIYDVTPGGVTIPQEQHGVYGLPTYVAGAGFNAATGIGVFQLTSGSKGYDQGVVIPNFTDDYTGDAPDIGAHEAGLPAMQFGIHAYSLFSLVGSKLTVTGDSGGDAFTCVVGAGQFVVGIDGDSQTFPSTSVSSIVLDGGGGNDSAVVTGGAAAETVTLGGAAGTVTATGYTITLTGINIKQFIGQANDVGNLNAASLSDLFTGRPTYSTIAGGAYSSRIDGAATITANAFGGANSNTAYLYDSAGADTYYATPTYAYLKGTGFNNLANGFSRVGAFSSAGGIDKAYLYDSAGNDTFKATAAAGYIQGTGFYNYASGFASIYAYAIAGGTDKAYLYDMPGNDSFVGNKILNGATSSYISGGGLMRRATGFDKVYAYASTGTDTAYVYGSSGADQFHARNNWGQLTRWNTATPTYFVYFSGFDSATINSTAGSDGRDVDSSVLYPIAYLSSSHWISRAG